MKIYLAVILVAGWIWSGNWIADASKAKVKFSVKGPFGTVHGTFGGLKSTIRFNEKDPAGSSISATIDPNTVSTGIGLRNHDLRNQEKWLDTKKYPEISFHSKKISKTGNDYLASGELTLKGITKPVDIPFTFTVNGNTGVFKGGFTIRREDFNIGKPGGSVGDVITIDLNIPVNK